MRASYWQQLAKAAATIHGSGYDRTMSTFPEQVTLLVGGGDFSSMIPTIQLSGISGDLSEAKTMESCSLSGMCRQLKQYKLL